jgi:hypothetical protein
LETFAWGGITIFQDPMAIYIYIQYSYKDVHCHAFKIKLQKLLAPYKPTQKSQKILLGTLDL